jgi:hypothetical protein
VFADVLIQRHLGVRPVTLIGFSLGARVIFYALLELARRGAFGIVQDVFIMGTTVTAGTGTWHQARGVVAGRFVNAYARNDWVLNYLFRATSGGLSAVAGLRPIEGVPALENVDVTDKIAGHMSYRTFMPLILDQLGFPVSADYFDEPEVRTRWGGCAAGAKIVQEPEFTEDRIVLREGEELPRKKGWFGRTKAKAAGASANVSRPPSGTSRFSAYRKPSGGAAPASADDDDELPPRLPAATPPAGEGTDDGADLGSALPAKAGFDFAAIKEALGDDDARAHPAPPPAPPHVHVHVPPARTESAPPLAQPRAPSPPALVRSSSAVHMSTDEDAGADDAFASGFGRLALGGDAPTLSLPTPDSAMWAPEADLSVPAGLGFDDPWAAGTHAQERVPAALGENPWG